MKFAGDNGVTARKGGARQQRQGVIMAEAGSGSPPDDGLVVTLYARVTGGGFRGAVSVRRASDEQPLEMVCELPEIFAQARLAHLAAGEFAFRARAAGTLLRMLEGWEQTRPHVTEKQE